MKVDPEALSAALVRASSELGLQEYYRDCVLPLFDMPASQWPACCASNCEPCARTLVAVADRTLELVGRQRMDLPLDAD